MSLVLGPIHYKVYNNILLSDKLAKLLLDLADCNCSLNNYADEIEIGELENLIGNEAIHGWLAERVERTEKRLAGVLKNCYTSQMPEDVLNKVYDFGKSISEEYPEDESLMEVLMRIRFNTLDGMPCDGGLIVIENSEDELVWEVNMDVHQDFVNDDVLREKFISIRTKFLEGLLENTKYKFEKIDGERYRLTV